MQSCWLLLVLASTAMQLLKSCVCCTFNQHVSHPGDTLTKICLLLHIFLLQANAAAAAAAGSNRVGAAGTRTRRTTAHGATQTRPASVARRRPCSSMSRAIQSTTPLSLPVAPPAAQCSWVSTAAMSSRCLQWALGHARALQVAGCKLHITVCCQSGVRDMQLSFAQSIAPVCTSYP
jgi:hypothetical protein